MRAERLSDARLSSSLREFCTQPPSWQRATGSAAPEQFCRVGVRRLCSRAAKGGVACQPRVRHDDTDTDSKRADASCAWTFTAPKPDNDNGANSHNSLPHPVTRARISTAVPWGGAPCRARGVGTEKTTHGPRRSPHSLPQGACQGGQGDGPRKSPAIQASFNRIRSQAASRADGSTC
mmetsp:Transcript_55372/g.147832  ORF Transcript_55372/g.147832 Transcript_55372/m.147832 type:complete len:178 (-) Transcript_55372:386-919(-)